MRVIHLSTHRDVGGAALSTLQLHHALLEKNVDSHFWFLRGEAQSTRECGFQADKKLLARGRRALKRMLKRYQRPKHLSSSEGFHGDYNLWDYELALRLKHEPIIHLHWTNEFTSPTGLAAMLPETSICITLHDLHPLTGGCHYPSGCERWMSGCGWCPQLVQPGSEDASAVIWKKRHSAYGRLDPQKMRLIATSRWVQTKAEQSPLLRNFQCTLVPLGVRTDLYQPMERSFARQAIGLNREGVAVLFISYDLRIRRKGLESALRAMRTARTVESNIFLVTVGKCGAEHRRGWEDLWKYHYDFSDNQRWLALIYSACDVFLMPSREEAFGQTCLEAMSCGLPVVAWNSGGMSDMVKDGETGILVDDFDLNRMTSSIVKLARDGHMRKMMGQAGRRRVQESFSWSHCAQKVIDVYQEMF